MIALFQNSISPVAFSMPLHRLQGDTNEGGDVPFTCQGPAMHGKTEADTLCGYQVPDFTGMAAIVSGIEMPDDVINPPGHTGHIFWQTMDFLYVIIYIINKRVFELLFLLHCTWISHERRLSIMYGGRIDSNSHFPVPFIIITILLVFIVTSPSSAQYLPWGINQYIYTYPNPQFGFGASSNLFGVSPFGFGYSSSNNIPIFSPFSRISINPENYYMPYGFGTTSAFGAFSRPYPFSGFGWRFPWRPW